MKIKHFLLIMTCLATVGCSSNRAAVITTPPSQDSGARTQIAEAAASTSDSLRTLAAVEQAASTHQHDAPAPNLSSYGLDALVSVDWSGPVEPLVRKIAEASDYKVSVLGHEPATPIMVLIQAQERPIGEVLRDAGYQCKERANIVVYPKTHVIELRYTRT